jgi:hypothetical protein
MIHSGAKWALNRPPPGAVSGARVEVAAREVRLASSRSRERIDPSLPGWPHHFDLVIYIRHVPPSHLNPARANYPS